MEDFKPFQFGKASDKKEEDKTAVAISYDPRDREGEQGSYL